MECDLPHTLYISKDKKKSVQKDVDDAEKKTREAYERKKRRTYSVDEVFAGVADR